MNTEEKLREKFERRLYEFGGKYREELNKFDLIYKKWLTKIFKRFKET